MQNHLNWLAVDTGMNACGVGIRRADGKIFSRIEAMERGQSERLMPLINEVAAEAGLRLADMDAYAVTAGPGTFTGLRVGLATVRALSQISGRPAFGIGTFDALAAEIGKPACILIETKRSDYYVRGPEDAEGRCMTPEQLKTFVQPGWLLAGDAVERAKAGLGFTNAVLVMTSPKPEYLIRCAETMIPSGYPEPVYLRDADVSSPKRRPARIV